jgi:hypothetical protein
MSAEIGSFLSAGYSAQQVLQMLDKTFPNIARGAKSALQLGRTAEDIVRLLSKLKVNDLKKIDKNAEKLDFTTPLERANKAARSQEQNPIYEGAKDVAKLGALAAGTFGAAKLIQGLNPKQFPQVEQNPYESTIQPSTAIPQENLTLPTGQSVPVSSLQNNIGPKPMSNAPVQPSQPNSLSQPTTATQPETNNISEPTQPNSSSSPEQSVSLIEQMGIGPQIQTLHSAGNNPEAISAAIGTTMKPHQRKWLDEQIKAGKAKPLPDLITDYISQFAANATASPQSETESQKQPEQPKLKPQKGEFVSSAEGHIGELKDIRDKEALIESEGKIHKVKASDLESLTNKYKDVHFDVSSVPEEDRSAPLLSISPNRDKTSITIEYFPKNSTKPTEEYEYFRKDGKPFDQGILERLREGVDIPVTSGVEWAGFWNATRGDSRGAANHKEIKMQAQDVDKVKSGLEKDDPSKPLFFYKKNKLFEHGFLKLAKQTLGQHAEGFRKEHKEITRGPKETRSKKRRP